MKLRVLTVAVAIALMGGAPTVLKGDSTFPPNASIFSARMSLPSAGDVRSLLDGATHFSEFVTIPAGVPAYVSYPDRAEKAPVVLLSASREGMTDWLRAMGAQLSREGFIAVVPDRTASGDDAAIRAYAAQIPAANGLMATLDVSRPDRRLSAVVGRQQWNSALDDHGWLSTVTFLRNETGNRYIPPAGDVHARMIHEEHLSAAARQTGSAGRGQGDEADGASSMASKRPGLPPHLNLAERTLAASPRKNEWVDIPMGTVKLHTWIVYPAGDGPAPVVVVVHGAGYGFNNWTRAVADQLAQEGFIALTPDLLSGIGPKGGNTDSFQYPDDITKAMGQLGSTRGLERVRTVRNYAMKLPRANGKSATLGFCFGGGQAFLMAAEPGVNAGVVFYGGPPPADVMAKITAPVIAFHGEDDARLTATVEPTAAAMKKLGKSYEPHIYRHATHAFLQFQDLADNFAATIDAWPKAVAFLKQHVR